MNPKLSQIIILVIVASIVIPIGIWLINYKTTFPVPEMRSESDIVYAIGNSRRQLFDNDGQPVFKIKSITKPEKGWYVVIIEPKNSQSDMIGKLIIHDTLFDKDSIEVAIGPYSQFKAAELSAKFVPQSVIREALK